MDQSDESRFTSTESAANRQQQQQRVDRFHSADTASTSRQYPVTPQQQQNLSRQSSTRAGPSIEELYAIPQYGPAPQAQYARLYREPSHVRPQSQPQVNPYGTSIPYGQYEQAMQASYGNPQQYRPRPGATIETLSTQFPDAQPTQYYLGAQPGPNTAAHSQLGATQVSHSFGIPSYAAAGPSTEYQSTMLEPLQQASFPHHEQQHSAFQTFQPLQHTYQSHPNQVLAQYQTSIRTVFTHVHNRALRETTAPLIEASRYLLGGVEALGTVNHLVNSIN